MMAAAEIEKRVFVVGVPRSGTTLVQSLLAAHSAVTSFTESHFFDLHFTVARPLPGPVLSRNPAPRVPEFLVENTERACAAAHWFEDKGRTTFRVRPLLPLWTRPAARHFLRVLDELAMRRGKTTWIEKTPRHLRYVPFLDKVSNSRVRTHFVHVIRDGLEVVSSLHLASQHWSRPYDLETCARRWNSDVDYSLDLITAPNNHFVVYEELTSRTERALKRLFAELDLEWEPDILERYGSASNGLITRHEAWKSDVGRSIRSSKTSDWALTEEQRAQVTRLLQRGLYERVLEHTTRRPRESGGPG